MPLHRNAVSTAALSITTWAAVLTGAAFLLREKGRRAAARPCHGPQDLRGNAYAKGSDVVKLYRDRLVKKLFIVTGATSGLGRHTAILLATQGANVILAVRNTNEGQVVAKEIQEQQGSGNVEVWHLDLSSLDSVRSFATKFAKSGKKLDGLVNNAGVYCLKGKTVDGYQTTWQTNAMAPALLTELLLPYMTEDARVIYVSSQMEWFVWSISDKCPPQTDGSSSMDYALSKACQVLHAHELTRRFVSQKSLKRAMAVEPGLVHTRIGRHAGSLSSFINYKLLGPVFLRTVDQGCATTLYCLLAPPEDLGTSGRLPIYYYADCAPKKPAKCCASEKEVEAQAKLFAELCKTE